MTNLTRLLCYTEKKMSSISSRARDNSWLLRRIAAMSKHVSTDWNLACDLNRARALCSEEWRVLTGLPDHTISWLNNTTVARGQSRSNVALRLGLEIDVVAISRVVIDWTGQSVLLFLQANPLSEYRAHSSLMILKLLLPKRSGRLDIREIHNKLLTLLVHKNLQLLAKSTPLFKNTKPNSFMKTHWS